MRLNEKHFAALFIVGVALLYHFGSVSPDLALLDIALLKLSYVAIFLGTAALLLHFLRGTTTDVLREIFVEHNIAAAILVAAFLLSIATVVGR
jgi:hypothetical protein